jgi:hypothetical protein
VTVTARSEATTAGGAPSTLRGLRSVPWGTATVLGAVMAFADGFWLTSLRGAVGAIQRVQSPFSSWLVESTLATPLFALGIAGALVLARRRLGPTPRGGRAVITTAALVVLAGTLVGVGQVAATSAYDYRLQSQLLRDQAATHGHVAPAVLGTDTPAASQEPAAAPALAGTDCDSTCMRQRDTLRLHARGIGYSAAVILLTNLVVVGWVLTWRGSGLAVTRRRATAGRATRMVARPPAAGPGT